jgi:hypothetical protein
MNMPKAKFRFGELETDEGIPSMDAVAEVMEANGIFGPPGDQRGVQPRTDSDEYIVGDDYIFIRFVKEVTEERKEIDGNEVTIGDSHIARIMRCLLTRNGSYAFETTSGVYDKDAIDYLIGDDSQEFGIDFECNPYNRFTREQMREFYEQSFRVRGLKLEEIGEVDSEESSVEKNIANYVDRAGENAVRAEFSTGSQDNNLAAPGIIDGFARLSEVKYIRMKDSEGQIREANRNGRYTFSYPADLDLMDQAERVRDILSTVTDGMVHEEDED